MPSRPIALTDRSGNITPIEEKLRDLASGSWSCHVAGMEQQRKKLRVPLTTTRCNSQFLVLWQIDVALDDTTQTESQLVKVWEVGTKTEMSQVIDRVALLQKSYSIKHVVRCRQKPQEDAGQEIFSNALPWQSRCCGAKSERARAGHPDG
jgi:predicted Zn-ribbon and HTH transcriptional regulator